MADRPTSGSPRSDSPRSDKPRSDKPRSDKPRSDKPRSDKPRSDKPRSDRPRSDERPRSDRPRSDSYSDSYQGRDARDDDSRESRGPWIPEEIIFEDLDKSVRFELQTLPESLQERVGRHLLAAEVALGQDDMDSALEHSRQAKKLAGRVAVVREANGTIEYLAGEYSAALNELRAVRRMTGNNEFVAIMADCERGLGRPEKAIEFLKSIPASQMSPETTIEALIVSAGARADMGQVDAALLMLNIGALTSLPPGDLRARMQEAYSVLLEQAGRAGEVQKWRSRAIKSDINAVTALVRNQESEITAQVIDESD
jgi:tetratricopeptide (TPR) repeat protein